jgi:hypothetical protein
MLRLVDVALRQQFNEALAVVYEKGKPGKAWWMADKG